MASVKALIAFGLGIIGAGLYWKLNEDVINSFILVYVRNPSDKYYLMSDILWESLPFVVILLGIVCLIFGGVSQTYSEGGE